MNILFTRFPLVSALHGGAENQTMALMGGLHKQGHRVEFLGSCPALQARTKELGIRNWALNIGPPPVTKWAAISFLWRRKKMKHALIDAFKHLTPNTYPLTPIPYHLTPSSIVMLSLTEKILLTPWAAEHGIKSIWLEHDRIGPWLTRNPWLPALRRASKFATIVCVSELSRMKYIELGFDPTRIVAIPNGVKGAVSGQRSAVSTYPAINLVCIARLSREKGIDVLIQAITDLPHINLTIVGKGSEEGYLRQLIDEDTRRLGLDQPRIRILHDVPEIDSIYASADALVLPSIDHDPFGLVAAEAMVRGIPVIVTDACGIAGYLKDGDDALIANAGSASTLSEAIQKLEYPELRKRIGSTGQKTALREFSLDRMVARYEEVLR